LTSGRERAALRGRRYRPGDRGEHGTCPAPRRGELPEPADCTEPIGADSGRGLWLAATLADELSITSRPDSTIVSLYMRLDGDSVNLELTADRSST